MEKRNKTVKTGKKNTSANAFIRLASFVGIFFAIAVLLLFNYARKQTQIVTDRIEESIIMTAGKYQKSVQSKMKALEETISVFSVLLVNDEYKKNETMIAEALSVFCQETDAYQAIVVNRFGEGISNLGNKVEIGSDKFPIVKNNHKVQFVYTEDDQITGNPAIVAGQSISGRGKYIIAYYKPDSMINHVDVKEYDGRTWASAIDGAGNILYTSGSSLKSLKSGNQMLELIKKGNGNKKEISLKMQNNRNILERIVLEEDEVELAFVPLQLNDWYFVMGVTGSYVDVMIRSELKTTNDFIRNFALLMVVFFGIIIIFYFISSNSTLLKHASLQKKVDMDLLTELNNKIATEQKIKEYMEENTGEQALLFVFDIDNFKKINDTRGHAFGDEVLRGIGMRLKSEFRASDIIGRTGGDEFMLFLKNIKDDSILVKESVRVAKLFENFQVGQYTKYSVTASIGCAIYPRDAEDFEKLYKAADSGLYKAKQRGKNQLAFYNEEDIHKVTNENVDNMTNN